MALYRILSLVENDQDGEPLYWSNENGWVDFESAALFTGEEIRTARLVGPWTPVLALLDRESASSFSCPCCEGSGWIRIGDGRPAKFVSMSQCRRLEFQRVIERCQECNAKEEA